jgi:hypothetical protein
LRTATRVIQVSIVSPLVWHVWHIALGTLPTAAPEPLSIAGSGG